MIAQQETPSSKTSGSPVCLSPEFIDSDSCNNKSICHALCKTFVCNIEHCIVFGVDWLPLVCVCISINAGASSGIAASNGRRKYGLSKGRNMVGMCLYKYFIFLPKILVQIENKKETT